MIDEDFYDPTIIGFVLAVEHARSDEIKNQLVSSVRKLESDDKCYMHHARSDFILSSTGSGSAVKSVADWKPIPEHELNLGKDMQQSMIVLANEDDDVEKHLFVVLDKFKPDWEYEFTKVLKMNLKLGCRIKFHFCNISEKSFETLEKIVSFFEESADFNSFSEAESLHNFIVSKFRNDEQNKQS